MSRRQFLSQTATTVTAGALTPTSASAVSGPYAGGLNVAVETPVWSHDDWVTQIIQEFDAAIGSATDGRLSLAIRPQAHDQAGSPGKQLAASLILDTGLRELPKSLAPIETKPFSLTSPDQLAWWACEDSTDVRHTLLDSNIVAFPVSLRPDSLGIWSSSALLEPSDLAGKKVAAANQTGAFFEQCGATLVTLEPANLIEAFRVGDIDILVSQGASIDEALGLFDTKACCYTPSIRGAAAVSWLLFSPVELDAAKFHFPDIQQRLDIIANSMLLKSYGYWQRRDRTTLRTQYDSGFTMKRLERRMLDWLYQQHESFRTHRADRVLGSNEWSNRDAASRLARTARMQFESYLS